MSVTRREFLTAAAAAGVSLAVPAIHAAEKSPKKYTTALIGCGWWGKNVLRTAIASGQSQVVAICDVDRRTIDPLSREVEKLTGDAPKEYKDYRELLSEVKPDIAIVATPDHWHALVTIAAVKAGSHVYVETPLSHTVHEGLAMVQAARAANRVVQVGLHRRMSPHNISAMKFLRDGKLGTVGMVRAFVYYAQDAGARTPVEEPPEGLDWDFWCGPGPRREYSSAIHPQGFRRFLEYANGQLGDAGVHWLDQILWWSGEKWPKRVFSSGGRRVVTDGTDAPDTQVVSYEFDSFNAVWEHRLYGGNEAEKHDAGCYFYGTEGTLHLGSLDGWTFYPRKKSDKVLHEEAKLHEPDQQNIPELWADFLQAIESGKRPACDIELGHYSANMALLGMLSLKLGRSVVWDGKNESVVSDSEANGMLHRRYRVPWQYPEIA
jgi:predicted dehydrogenase